MDIGRTSCHTGIRPDRPLQRQGQIMEDGAAVGIKAGPYAGRRGWVSWSNDIVVCVRLEPRYIAEGEAALTFAPDYVFELGAS